MPSPRRSRRLYLCAVKDCYSGRIVGYSIDSRMQSTLAAPAIRNAIGWKTPSEVLEEQLRSLQQLSVTTTG